MVQKGAKSSLPKWQVYKSTLATLVNSENFAMGYEKISLWVNFAMGYGVRRKLKFRNATGRKLTFLYTFKKNEKKFLHLAIFGTKKSTM